jgi:hypothetical protein
VAGVSGSIDSLAEVKTGDAIESGVVVAERAAIRLDLRVANESWTMAEIQKPVTAQSHMIF